MNILLSDLDLLLKANSKENKDASNYQYMRRTL